MHEAVRTTRELIPDHYATLLGERPAGSRWGRPFTAEDFALPWRATEPPRDTRVEGCRYFVLDGQAFAEAFPEATVGAVPYGSLTAAQRAQVRLATGTHGPELRLPLGTVLAATEAWLIVGPHDGRDVVFTVHPGPVMLPCPDVKASVAVKIA